MVKFASTLVVAALVAAPVFASSWEEIDSRDLAEPSSLFTRELSFSDADDLFTRETEELFSRVAEDLDARDIELQDLSERSKIGRFFKKMWHGIKKVASVVMRREDGEDEVLARSEELDLDELFERYIEEIDERSPGFMNFMKEGMTQVKHNAHHPEAHSVAHHAAHHAVNAAVSAQNQNNDRRALDDLELDLAERDDFEDELYGRAFTFDEEDELLAREFDAEFDERDFEELDELD